MLVTQNICNFLQDVKCTTDLFYIMSYAPIAKSKGISNKYFNHNDCFQGKFFFYCFERVK